MTPPGREWENEDVETGNTEQMYEDTDEMVNMVAMMDCLQTLGVSALNANRFAKDVSKTQLPVNFFEIYGRGGISSSARRCPSMNVVGLEALDLATGKPDGTPWNFLRI